MFMCVSLSFQTLFFELRDGLPVDAAMRSNAVFCPSLSPDGRHLRPQTGHRDTAHPPKIEIVSQSRPIPSLRPHSFRIVRIDPLPAPVARLPPLVSRCLNSMPASIVPLVLLVLPPNAPSWAPHRPQPGTTSGPAGCGEAQSARTCRTSSSQGRWATSCLSDWKGMKTKKKGCPSFAGPESRCVRR